MEVVTHDGRTTAYRVTGVEEDGLTVLYVHGSGGNRLVWAHQYAPRGLSHPAAAVDLSGHGESDDVDTEPGPETLSAYASDVVAVAREIDADVLVGNSLGGAVVFQTLLEETFDPVATVFAGTGAKLAVHEDLRRMLRDDFESAVEQLHEPSFLFSETDQQFVEQSKNALRDTGRSVTCRDFLTCHEFDVRDRLDEITVPALAIVGENDRLTPPSYHEYLASELADCELEVLSGVAHLAMLERPAAFNRALESFFTRQFE